MILVREGGGRGFMNNVLWVLVFGILGRDAVWELFRGSVGAVGAEMRRRLWEKEVDLWG